MIVKWMESVMPNVDNRREHSEVGNFADVSLEDLCDLFKFVFTSTYVATREGDFPVTCTPRLNVFKKLFFTNWFTSFTCFVRSGIATIIIFTAY